MQVAHVCRGCHAREVIHCLWPVRVCPTCTPVPASHTQTCHIYTSTSTMQRLITISLCISQFQVFPISTIYKRTRYIQKGLGLRLYTCSYTRMHLYTLIVHGHLHVSVLIICAVCIKVCRSYCSNPQGSQS